MTDVQLSRLRQVDLRKTWESEPDHFTPWLGRNLDLLGDALGIELEEFQQEHPVGPYRADIVCRDIADGSWVLIENQLEYTDHVHLGQILTYAAGLNAVTIVWIARRFTDEHRAALDWLNENSTDNLRFFGLEIEVWRIDASRPAPRFNIVSKPNAWTKSIVSVTKGLSPAGEFRRGFWRGFLKYVESHASRFTAQEASGGRGASWLRFGLGRTGFYVQADMLLGTGDDGNHEVGELYAGVTIEDKDYSNQYFDQLYAQKDEIETEVEATMGWNRKDDVSNSYIGFRPVELREHEMTREVTLPARKCPRF